MIDRPPARERFLRAGRGRESFPASPSKRWPPSARHTRPPRRIRDCVPQVRFLRRAFSAISAQYGKERSLNLFFHHLLQQLLAFERRGVDGERIARAVGGRGAGTEVEQEAAGAVALHHALRLSRQLPHLREARRALPDLLQTLLVEIAHR